MKKKSLKDLFLLRDHEVNRFLTETPRDYFIPGDYVINNNHIQSVQTSEIGLDTVRVYKIIYIGNDVAILTSGLQDGIPLTQTIHIMDLGLLTRAKFNELYTEFKTLIFPAKINSPRLLKKIIYNLVSKIYPEERFEVTEETSFGQTLVFLRIHYPEITITNSTGQELHTKNFYAQLMFGQNKQLNHLEIARTHYKTDELIIGSSAQFYIHSHVSRTTPGEWAGNFCFGDTPIKRALSNLLAGKLGFLNTFLLNFETILGWESIEGAPHINMGQALRKFAEDVVREAPIPKGIDRVEDFFYHKLVQNHSPDLDYSIGKYGQILVKDAEQIHTILDEIASQYSEKLAHTVYPYDEIREISGIVGINSNKEDDIISAFHGKQSDIIFKGERQLVNIEKAEDKAEEKYPKRVHKDIVRQIVKRLEESLTEFLIKNINYYDKSENIQREYSNS